MTPNTDIWTPWSVDPGSLSAVPAANDNVPPELRGLGAAIGKVDYKSLIREAVERFPVVHAALAASERKEATNLPHLIALTGVAGSGKSTATKYLIEHHGYKLVKFAGPLKDMMRAIGLGEGQIEGEHKEEPCSLLSGKTPRHAMQTLGTEWGRNCMGDDFWVNLWRSRANAIIAFSGRVVTDDCRFPNEAKAIHDFGGKIIKLTGRGGISGAHESENGCGTWDSVVENDGCVTALYADVEEAIRRAA